MIELKDELFAAPADVWNRVPFAVSRHKWLLLWCRFGDNCGFCLSFVSPRGRMYSYYPDSHGIVTSAEVVVADGGQNVASYYKSWGDKLTRLEAVIGLTPKHILDRLHMLLDAIR